MGIPDHLICLLRNLYAGQEATVRTGHGITDCFQTGKGTLMLGKIEGRRRRGRQRMRWLDAVKDAGIFGLQRRGIQSGTHPTVSSHEPDQAVCHHPQADSGWFPWESGHGCCGSLWVLVSVGSCQFGWSFPGEIYQNSEDTSQLVIQTSPFLWDGHRGKGNIYEWASGDSGSYDDCNCDGYASTISINSSINDGRIVLYDKSWASALIPHGCCLKPQATPDLYGNCTLRPSGTSAGAPEAAGVFTLVLEANLGLTWRDMQHLTVLTPKQNQLHDKLNHLFGYRVLDAGAIVKMAKDSKMVPERFHCNAKVGFDKWPFMTTHTWGEDARGTWTLELGFVGSAPQKRVQKEWALMLYGTQSAPYIDQVVRDHQSKLAMSKKEEPEEELDEAMQRSLKSILGKD
ncbi:hypothetical protein FD755_007921 [Muntiacus reevesi]|uniref:Neuroendocrine convertase 2 n=1 Tax=Muntiacus reevesi TaxID=9886 RepID=A0A5J5MKF6_MUNRE|nr:hypothetical protein FD755_007921 [Muntiacus reevesi]